jgi:lipid II:glycine glycyltransferase (peptidoglycan interpeptide bridge formation enzyme)
MTEIIRDKNPIIDDIRQSDPWMECLKLYGWKIFTTTNNTKVALMTTFMGSFIKIYKPPILTKDDLLEIEALAKKRRGMFIRIEPNVGQDVNLMESMGYVTSPHPFNPTKNAYFDLTMDLNNLWNSFSESVRYSINRARREGTIIEKYLNPDETKLKEFFDMHWATAQLKSFGAKPFSDMKYRAGLFGDQAILLMSYDKNHNLCNGKLLLAYKGNVWYTYGGSTTLGRKNKAGYLLQWATFEELKKMGYKYLDLDGLYDDRFPNKLKEYGGFSHFKERFNPIVVEFPLPYVKYLSPVMRMLKKLYGDRVSL